MRRILRFYLDDDKKWRHEWDWIEDEPPVPPGTSRRQLEENRATPINHPVFTNATREIVDELRQGVSYERMRELQRQAGIELAPIREDSP